MEKVGGGEPVRVEKVGGGACKGGESVWSEPVRVDKVWGVSL